jgi:hypothetical protein
VVVFSSPIAELLTILPAGGWINAWDGSNETSNQACRGGKFVLSGFFAALQFYAAEIKKSVVAFRFSHASLFALHAVELF